MKRTNVVKKNAGRKFVIFYFILITGCSGNVPPKVESNNDSIIDLSVIFNDKNIRSVRLSEIADSISFLPFETSTKSLMGEFRTGLTFTHSFIFYNYHVYDWNGKYITSTVKSGQGPLEEPQPLGARMAYNDNHFYSKASKFIEYDITGKPTGKRRHFSDPYAIGSMGFSAVGENFVIYNVSNMAILFFNKNFETISSRQIIQLDSTHSYAYSCEKTVTSYKDTAILYNVINDTIFQITDTILEPRWIVSFNHPLRYPPVLDAQTHRMGELAFQTAIRGGSNMDNSEFVILTDRKHRVIDAYETESYVFFPMTEAIPFAALRGIEPPKPYIVFYKKDTGLVTRVKGDGFIDDMLGLYKDSFYPELGFYNEKMIKSIWPYKIFEHIEECNERGVAVNPQLLALSKKIKPDDNPVLILVHLKQ